MQKLAKKHGFSLVRKLNIDELDATLFELSHDQTGAKLIYLDREDDNKTFAISFNTPPSDSTGVFHIIEHSVLCGSESYPLKDPFAELLKGSLNTFLNAMTYEDRTVYPVSSRCDKDFQNLVGVYLDAVFFPKLLENPSIFRQEGWHYEYDSKSDSLSYNGVVYNEMKGAYSSPDELGAMALSRALYPDTIYECDSGGNPDEIPSLSYADFKSAHERHYHPSNSLTILDGKIDIDSLLCLINSYFSRFDAGERIILPDSVGSAPKKNEVVKYEISDSEEERDKARILFGYTYSDCSDKKAQIAATILSDLLCGSNASPLKKALLDQGICKDAVIYSNKARRQTVTLELIDTNADCLEAAENTVAEVIEDLCRGIDKSQLEAIINHIEFKLRERDFGTLPSGISYALAMLGVWSYGAAPESALMIDDALAALKDGVNQGYFEGELRRIFLCNERQASVVMLPDKNLGVEMLKRERDRLQRARLSLSEEELEEIKQAEAALRAWQESEEDVSVLPSLSISDIPTKREMTESSVLQKSGVKILKNDVKTNGIVYISLIFDASDLSGEEICVLSILCSLLLNLPTESFSPLALQGYIKANLGSFVPTVFSAKRDGRVMPYFKIGASLLASKADELLRVISEVLLNTKYVDEKEIESIILQLKSQAEDSFASSGESLAISRVEASVGSVNFAEFVSGYEAYRLLCAISREKDFASLIKKLKALTSRIFTKKRLLISCSGETGEEMAIKIADLFPEGEEYSAAKCTPCAEKGEYFVTPSKVSYAVAGNISAEAKENIGILRVVRSILSYEYLWNTIRVKNGAYGAGFITRKDGFVGFYSYRDPSPALSLECYASAPDYLRALAESECDLTKFIIGALGEYDIIVTPRISSLLATQNYLNGWTSDDEDACRRTMLGMTRDDLRTAADIIEEAMQSPGIAVVGAAEHLRTLDGKIKKVIKI